MKQRRRCPCGGYFKLYGWEIEFKDDIFLPLRKVAAFFYDIRGKHITKYYYECVKCGKLSSVRNKNYKKWGSKK